MPAKRKNTSKKANPGLPRAFGRAGSKKQSNPSLNLVLKRLDKFDQRFDAFDRKVDTVQQETAAELKAVHEEIAQGRQENVAELKVVRQETAQAFANMEQRSEAEFKAVRGEIAQGFDSQRQEFKTEPQKEFEKYGAKTHPLYTRLENKVDTLDQKFSTAFNQLHTGMEAMAKNYEQFGHDSAIIDAEHQDLKKDVETLKKRDMGKAAAIEKIEKQIKAA